MSNDRFPSYSPPDHWQDRFDRRTVPMTPDLDETEAGVDWSGFIFSAALLVMLMAVLFSTTY